MNKKIKELIVYFDNATEAMSSTNLQRYITLGDFVKLRKEVSDILFELNAKKGNK